MDPVHSERRDVLRFGGFEADTRTGELRRAGVRVRLPGQSFQVLAALLRRPGELVAREELKQELWPAESFGDFEHGLNAAVNRLREALGDSAEKPRYVETLPRRGYRFVGVLEAAPQVESDAPAVDVVAGSEPAEPAKADLLKVQTRTRRVLLGAAMILVCLAALAMVSWRGRPRGPQAQVESGVRVTPLTTLPGMEISPAFSPDGSQVAFAWDGGSNQRGAQFDLYVKVVGAEALQRLTHRPANWIFPAWSPDGRTIAFARVRPGEAGIFLISPLGGPERRLVEADFGYFKPISLSWSPDGRRLFFAETKGSDHILETVDAGSGAVQALPSLPVCRSGFTPTSSPDGRWIAFNCYLNSSGFGCDLWLMHPDGSEARVLTRIAEVPLPLAWSRDGSRLIYSQSGALLQIRREGGRPEPLTFVHDADEPAVSLRGDRMAYVKTERNVNLWRVELQGGTRGSTQALALTSSEQRAPDISPDGQRMAFESERSGSHEVWSSNLDGSEAVQLSDFHSLTGTPRWSPDGRHIVFDSRPAGVAALFLVDPSTARPVQLDLHGMAGSVPSWSRDGRWIFFHSDRNGQIYKVPATGGWPALVSRTEGYNLQEARDGQQLYFADRDIQGRIRVLTPATGEEHLVEGMPPVYPTDWMLGRAGIYFVDRDEWAPSIGFFAFSEGRVAWRIALNKEPEIWGGIALAPDESWLAFAQIDAAGSDLMLAEGFR